MIKKQWDSIATIARDVTSGKQLATDLVERSLQLIRDHDDYNTVIQTCHERARKRAEDIDAAIQRGETVGRLAGVPFIAKDNFLTLGSDTTAASNMLRGFTAPYQATAVDRLEAEGAICVAKANLDAFAHGSSTENSDWFTTKNPHDKTRVPGGSSGGSAAAVALSLAPFALGTDTGGSIRLPASFCGVVGYKPTYGLVSRSGVIAMASSTDVIGPITASVADAGLVLDCMAGVDERDSTTVEPNKNNYADISSVNLRGKKIALIRELMPDSLPTAIKQSMAEATKVANANGATIDEISLPSLSLALACYYVICPAEISSNLSRYDGQKYGFTDPDAQSLTDSYTQSRSKGFGKEAKRRIMIGTYVLSSGFYDAYYRQAQQVRTKLIQEFSKVFADYDAIISPTAPTTAFKIGENITDPLEMYLTDVMTVAANLTGIPAVSIPGGNDGGLPIGLQLMMRQHNDHELLKLAHTFEELLK